MPKVYVKKVRGKFHLVTFNDDGTTNWQVTDHTRRRHAEREAKEFEATLQIAPPNPTVSFDECCLLYRDNHLSKKSAGYRSGFWSVINKVKEVCPIDDAGQINQSWLDDLANKMPSGVESLSTVEGYLKVVRAFVNWLVEQGHVSDVSRVRLQDGTVEVLRKKLKVNVPTVDANEAAGGEAITFKQFKLLIESAPLVLEASRSKGFVEMLWGFWYSGFRIGEMFRLTWDDQKSIHIDGIDEPVSYVVFPQRTQKAQRFERWVMPPDLQNHLRELPRLRQGFVYQPLSLKLHRYRHQDTVGDVISKIFTRANIKVENSKGELVKANTKDIRRACSDRWYDITGDPDKVARLMRHRDFKTTKRFYKRKQAEQFAKELQENWK